MRCMKETISRKKWNEKMSIIVIADVINIMSYITLKYSVNDVKKMHGDKKKAVEIVEQELRHDTFFNDVEICQIDMIDACEWVEIG